jgi:SAM-dependent methyltransferase
MDLKSTYNKIAEDWAKDHDNDTWWQEGTDHFLSLLPKDATILDVGCGAGRKTRYISDKGYSISGVDFSEKMLEIARRENPESEFTVLDVYELDTLDKKYDAVFAQAVLLHIPKTRVPEVLRKMKNILKPNGLLYLAVKNIRDDAVEEKVVTENDYGYEYSRFFSYFGMDELKKYLTDLSFEIVWETKAEGPKRSWLQIVGKSQD